MLDENIRMASDDLGTLHSDANARRMYELREKALMNERGIVRFAEEKGRKEGIKEGIKEGKEEERLRLAREMLRNGLEKTQICRITGLSLEQLNQLED